MESLRGQLVRIHPLKNLHKQADLIFFEGPLLSLFENSEGEPYLFLWCDTDDHVNRWIVCRVADERLRLYLNGSVSLREIVSNPSDGFVFVVDVDDALEYESVHMIVAGDLPDNYIPSVDSYYESKFLHPEVDLLGLARRYKSPLLDLHLIDGKGIRYGSSDILTLGPFLTSTGELAKNVAVSLFSGDASKGKEKIHPSEYGRFEYFTNKAASFSAILRPLASQETLPGFSDKTAQVVTVLMELLTGTSEYEGLKKAAATYQDNVIRSLEHLLEDVQAFKAKVELRWANPQAERVTVVSIDRAISGKILSNITRLDHEESQQFETRGVFIALNMKNKTYRFKAVSGRESNGRFDSKIAYPLTHLSFEKEYNVYMTRKFVRLGGRNKPKIAETIGFVEPVEE